MFSKDNKYKKIFASNLNYYMQLKGKTQTDIINDLDINKSAISSWCNATRLPRMDKIELLASYLNINITDLIDEKKEDTKIINIEIPLLSNFKNNYTYSLNNFFIKKITINQKISHNTFGFLINDSSMLPLLDLNDIAIVEQDEAFISGRTYLLINHGIAIIRKVLLIDGYYELHAMNPYFPIEKTLEINIIGKVIKAENQSAFK